MSGQWPIVLPARLEGGSVKLNSQRLDAMLRGRRDCDLEIIIERKHATRSLAQNAFYWSVVVASLSEHTGYTPDEIHEILKAKFLPKTRAITDRNGEIVGEFVIGGSTTALNKIEFGEYIEQVRVWAAELGVYIPDPDPEWKTNATEAA